MGTPEERMAALTAGIVEGVEALGLRFVVDEDGCLMIDVDDDTV
jgi:cyanophycinase-like exopeptidase